jgi:cobalt/nickel transport system permease protein
MHLPDHYLDPVTTTVAAVAATGAVAVALRRVRHDSTASWRLMGAVAAGIFAGQMVNFAIGTGTSGHLIGGALAAIVVGPLCGILAMTLVLAVQAIVFGDGGIVALGANVLNMAVIGCFVGHSVYDRALRASPAGSLVAKALASGFAAWTSVAAAALACAIELAVSGQFAAFEVVAAMVPIHALIGVAEAGITAAVVLVCSPVIARDIEALGALHAALQRRVIAIGLIAVALIALILVPLASELPDGLEVATAQSRSVELESTPLFSSPLPDYSLPGIDAAWATALVGLIGVAIVVAMAEAIHQAHAALRS